MVGCGAVTLPRDSNIIARDDLGWWYGIFENNIILCIMPREFSRNTIHAMYPCSASCGQLDPKPCGCRREMHCCTDEEGRALGIKDQSSSPRLPMLMFARGKAPLVVGLLPAVYVGQ